MKQLERWRGLLLGTAAGDALGLPLEGLSRSRQQALFPGPLRHRLLPGKGMISDDTEHAIFTLQALLRHPDDPVAFQRRLARSLRWWLAALPAGIGLATGRAILKLWIGVPPQRAGVYSAGNGPLMRAPVIGAFACSDRAARQELVDRSTRLTHIDPKAIYSARSVAELAARIQRGEADDRPNPGELLEWLDDEEAPESWRTCLNRVAEAAENGISVGAFADALGLKRGVSGFVEHTAPVVFYAWWRHHDDPCRALSEVIALGGDADSTGALIGALAFAGHGAGSLPEGWVSGIVDWPRGIGLLEGLASAVAANGMPVAYAWPMIPVRNAAFLVIVLLHGLRRLLPPYA